MLFTKIVMPLIYKITGGFTLNGQYNTIAKKKGVTKFCSSHKISLVVSTFSLMVTIGLLITLVLMKSKFLLFSFHNSSSLVKIVLQSEE